MYISIFVIIFLLYSSSSSCYAAVQNFCVADTQAQGPAGFNCKGEPKSITVDHFVLKGNLAKAANFSNIAKSSFTPAFVDNLPGLNGLGLSIARFDLEVGGFFPMHTHPEATEIFVITSGSVTAGFISGANDLFSTDLNAGDVFVIPPGLLHFVINKGNSPVLGYVSFNSPRPVIQLLGTALFGNDLPTDLLAKATFIDADQIKKLKGMFKGSN